MTTSNLSTDSSRNRDGMQEIELTRRDFLHRASAGAATLSAFGLFESTQGETPGSSAVTATEHQGIDSAEISPTATPVPKKELADTVYWNGKFYTMQLPGSHKAQEAVAVKGERIVFVGDKDEAANFIGDKTKTIDLHGGSVYPGFTDAHIHPLEGGEIRLMCNLGPAKNLSDVLNILNGYANEHPDLEWIRASNLSLPSVIGHPPPVDLLDEIIPDRPVYIESETVHSAWVNSKALELAGISSETTDPKGGTIVRKSESTEPSGLLLEPPAMSMVSNLIPPFSRADQADSLRFSIKMLNRYGVTNLIAAQTKPEDIGAFLDLANRGTLTAHVRFSLYADIAKGEQAVADTLALKSQIESSGALTPDITLNQVKLFIDGTVEEETAAMQENYSGQNHRGRPFADAEMTNRVITAFDRAGMQVHVHAIGDLGVKMVLDAFEYARKLNGTRDSRHHIAHLHVVDPKDIERFHELGVTANFQALWASGDDSYVKKINPGLLGDQRINWQYPIGAIVRSGASVVFSSDWPVSSANPIRAMQVAATRRGPSTKVKEAWMPEQLIDISTAVEGYTRKGAWISFRDKECGTLEKGKLADLVILNEDLFTGSKFELINRKIQMTVFRGKVVYKRD